MKQVVVATVVVVALLAVGLWYVQHGPIRPNDAPVMPEAYCQTLASGGHPSPQPGIECNGA